jgi:DNA-binding NarL/FixJ family response regulator
VSTDTTEFVHVDPRAALPRWQPATFDGQPTLVDLPPMLVNILDSLCEGKSNRQIGNDWGISEDTVKTHLKRLYGKLGVGDRLQAVVLVLSGAVDVRLRGGRQRQQWVIPPLDGHDLL